LAIVNSEVSTGVQVSFQHTDFSSYGIYLAVGLLDLIVVLFLINFLRTSILFSTVAVPIYIFIINA
jgi:hypothetical protein